MGGKINAMDDKIGAMGGSKIRWEEEIPDGKNKKVDGQKKRLSQMRWPFFTDWIIMREEILS